MGPQLGKTVIKESTEFLNWNKVEDTVVVIPKMQSSLASLKKLLQIYSKNVFGKKNR